MIEFRNETDKDLFCRIVKVTTTGNYFVYVSDPDDFNDEELMKAGENGWRYVRSNWYSPVEKIQESQF